MELLLNQQTSNEVQTILVYILYNIIYNNSFRIHFSSNYSLCTYELSVLLVEGNKIKLLVCRHKVFWSLTGADKRSISKFLEFQASSFQMNFVLLYINYFDILSSILQAPFSS